MEELREAAIAYYSNGSSDLRMLAQNFFRSLDVNGDGSVTMIEFVKFLQQQGYPWISTDLFTELDRNGDGCLDFWEVMTMYYIVKTRTVICKECRALLKGMYITCVVCFDCGDDTYDICSRCYKRQTFSHQHNCFLDSYVLLRSRRGTSHGTTNLNLAQLSSSQPRVVAPVESSSSQPRVVALVDKSEKVEWLEALEALERGLTIAGLVGCTIM